MIRNQYTLRLCAAFVLAATGAAPLHAQRQLDILGTYRVDVGTDTKNGPREVIIRADSSASWGKETVRWRLKGDQISIVIGGEWETHHIKIENNILTISDGGLDKPVSLRRIGPPTPRPANVKIPDDPDDH